MIDWKLHPHFKLVAKIGSCVDACAFCRGSAFYLLAGNTALIVAIMFFSVELSSISFPTLLLSTFSAVLRLPDMIDDLGVSFIHVI